MSALTDVLARLGEIRARAEKVRDEAECYPDHCRVEEYALAGEADAMAAALEEAHTLLLTAGYCFDHTFYNDPIPRGPVSECDYTYPDGEACQRQNWQHVK